MKHIGLDVGNGSTCIFVRKEDGITDYKMYSSTFGDYEDTSSQYVIKKKDDQVIDVFGLLQRKYVVGYEAVLSTKTKPFGTYSREDRIHLGTFQRFVKLALLDAATMDGSSGVIEISLGFGVPNEDYRDEKLKTVADWFSEPITGTKNGKQIVVIVKEIELVSQPIAVLMDAYYDLNGSVRDKAIEDDDVLVIDSGSGTLDMTEFSRFYLKKQTSEAIGMNDVYQIVMDEIKRREPKVRINAYDLEYQIREQLKIGSSEMIYKYGPLTIPITEVYNKARDIVWDQLVNSIEREYPNRTRFHRVLLAGGTGDAFYSNFVNWMPQIQKTPEPQLAIARGLCKYVVSLSLADEVIEVPGTKVVGEQS